jgi:hypothetical protein
VKNIGYNFGMFRIFLLAVLVTLPLISFHVYEYFTNHNDALIFSNSISMYTEITLLASTFATLRWALFQSILWSPHTHTTPSTIPSFFRQSSRLLKSSILPTLQSPTLSPSLQPLQSTTVISSIIRMCAPSSTDSVHWVYWATLLPTISTICPVSSL